MKITENIKYIGVNDHKIDLFEGQYAAKNGMSYNSYIILDEKIAILDTVDANFTDEWLNNVITTLDGRIPDYLIVQHMEPDHSASIKNLINTYPEINIVASSKAFSMIENFFGCIDEDNKILVENCNNLCLGKHNLTFFAAPMVHWPEVIFTYESEEKVLFSADAFGKFGALDVDDSWLDEARRYYFGIVGKYGVQVQSILAKLNPLEIQTICPLHGKALDSNLDFYFNKYLTWSSYTPEDSGIVIAYTSIYGNTKKAVMELYNMLKDKGANDVILIDLARTEWSSAVANAFRYNKLVLATTTYNSGIFPYMRHFIDHIKERNYRNRTVAFIENGSWAPTAAKIMKNLLLDCKNIEFVDTVCSIRSAMNQTNYTQLEEIANKLLS